MSLTVFDAVGKFSADTSQLDQFIVKLEQGLPSASDRAAAATQALKAAQDDFRAAIKAVSAEGGNTADNLQRLADAEKNLTLAAAASKTEHAALKDSLGAVGNAAKEAGGSMMESRHTVMILGVELGVHIPRAVATMIASIGPLGSLLTAAFPVAGVLLLITVIGKAIEAHQKHAEAMRKSAAAAEDLTIKQEDQTAALEVANLRLEDSIKKLEGHPATNQLAIALREVQTRADDLATTFAKDFQSMDQDVADLNGVLQKSTDYVVNYLKAFSDFWLSDMRTGYNEAKQLLKARGQETAAVKQVQQAEAALEQTRLASHQAATKDTDAQRNALNNQAAAAFNLQKSYETLADTVSKVDPNNTELIEKLRNHAKSAESDWKDLQQEIRGVGLTAKETADTVAQELAKRAEAFSKIKIQGTEKGGILDADKIRQDGELAYAAETAAIKQIVDAEVEAGHQREQVELDMISRIVTAEKNLNDAKLSALNAGHLARLAALKAEHDDILRYEKGDDQLKALAANQNQQNEENKKYELDREKIAADGEAKLTDIAAKGAAERIALQNSLKKAILELAKADEQLIKSQAKLGSTDISQVFKAQEEAINRLAQFHVISEQEKAQRLALLYKQESDAQVSAFEDAERKIALTSVRGNPLFTPEQVEDLRKNLAAAAGDFDRTIAAIKSAYGQVIKQNPFLTDAQVTQLKLELDKALLAMTDTQSKVVAEKTQINQKLLALDKSYYGEAVALAVANGQKILAQQLMETHASLVAAQQRLAEAKSRGENAQAIAQEVAALKNVEQGLTKEALGRKASQAAIQSAIHASLLDAQAELAAAKARGANTLAIENEVKALRTLEGELRKQDQLSVNGAKQQLRAWQQFGAGFREDVQKNQKSLEDMGTEMRSDISSLTQDMGAAFAAMALGQESAGEAIEKAMAKLIAQIAQQWAQYFAAMAIADIFFDPAKAAAEIAAAVALEALGGILSSVGSSSKSSSSASSKGTAAPKAGSPVTTAQPNPVQVVNTQHLASGGLATQPTLVTVGDNESGDR